MKVANLMPKLTVILSVLVMTLMVLMPGCWGKLELEDRSLVTLIGIDSGEKNEILLTTVIAIPRTAAAGILGGRGGAEGSAVILSAEGRNLFDALDNIEAMSSRRVTPIHAAVVIIGDDLAKKDVAPVIDAFTRSLEFRDNTLVAISQGKAMDFIKGFTPLEETEPSTVVSKLISTANLTLGACPVVTMHEFISAYTVLGADPWAPYLALAAPAPPEEESGTEGAEKPDQSGNSAGLKTVNVKGAAVFGTEGEVQKMVGALDRYQTFGALILRNDFRQGRLDIAMPGGNQEATLFLHHSSVRTKVNLSQDTANFAFTVRVTGSLEEARIGLNGVEPSAAFRKALSITGQEELGALLRGTLDILKSVNSDVIGLGKSVQGKFRGYSEWEVYDFPSRFPGVTAQFDVKMFIFTSGFTFRRPEPR